MLIAFCGASSSPEQFSIIFLIGSYGSRIRLLISKTQRKANKLLERPIRKGGILATEVEERLILMDIYSVQVEK